MTTLTYLSCTITMTRVRTFHLDLIRWTKLLVTTVTLLQSTLIPVYLHTIFFFAQQWASHLLFFF